MSLIRAFCVGVVVLATLVVVSVSAGADADSFAPVMIKGHPAHPTRLLAKVKPVAATSAHASALAANGLQTVRGYDLLPGLVLLDTAPQTQAMAAAATGASNAEVQAALLQTRIESLRASGLFEYVEPDYLVFSDATPTDTAFTAGTLWGLRNTGQNGGLAGVDIDAVRAWDITTGSSNVIVAVIDTGIRYSHRDLASQMWRNPGEIAGNGVDDDGNGYVDDVFGINSVNGSGDPVDSDGHGTHVAGTIGAAANNGYGHVGVAWQVRLMGCKFLSENGGGRTSDAIKCIDYAVAHGAQILNCSWGGRSFSRALQDAIVAAGERGALVVAAAGNDQVDNDRVPHFPASFDVGNILSVAAIDRRGNLASFSNYGASSVDLGAPGVDIYSTFHESDASYFTVSGTSMAAPHVSGVAALVRARYPSISPADLWDRLVNTTTSTDSMLGVTASGGRVNAFLAVSATGDGVLRVSVHPRKGTTLFHGRSIPVVARVTELVGVTGAQVFGVVDGGSTFNLRDDGVAPDLRANDGNYTGLMETPAAGEMLNLRVTATAQGKASGIADVRYALRAPPPNDDFANRISIPSSTTLYSGSNFGATRESGEPSVAGHRGGASVWWTWTASADATVTMTTQGSSFDTVLGVFTGTSLSDLVEVGGNDDFFGVGGASQVKFAAASGVTYQVVVDGWEGETGDITLNVTTDIPPANDLFAKSLVLSGAAGSAAGTSVNSTMEPGEPNHFLEPEVSRNSVWWRWTAPTTDTAVFHVSSGGHGQPYLVVVYAGTQLDDLRRLPTRATEWHANVDGFATVAVDAGETYFIAVATAYDGPRGDFALEWVMANRPPNDRFADRALLAGTSAQDTGTTYAATREIGEPAHGFFADGASVWWTWTAPADGTATLVVPEGNVVAAISVYTGSSVAALTLVGRNLVSIYDFAPRRLAFPTTAGTLYQIAVDAGTWGTGPFSVSLSWGLAPANDQFAGRTLISGTLLAISGSNIGASREADEPMHPQGSGNTVWWSWTAPSTGTAVIESRVTSASGYAVLAAFTGDSLSALVPVWDNGGDATSVSTLFRAIAGTTYQIAVDGHAGFTGPLQLELSLHASPVNDQFSDRAVLVGSVVEVKATHAYATSEPAEPLQGPGRSNRSVWWTWTAPNSGPTTIRVADQFSNTSNITVFSGENLAQLSALLLNHQTSAQFLAVAGSKYQIRVTTGTGQGAPFTLYLHRGVAPPNDNFANRLAIAGAAGHGTADNRSATAELDEWFRTSNASAASTWWTWKAPATGRVAVSTMGSSFRTLLEVYRGSSLDTLTSVVSNRPELTVFDPVKRVIFDAVAGETYQIVVDGFLGEVGDISLDLAYAIPPQNDDFAHRAVITGLAAEVNGTNFAASTEANDPSNARANVWWTWTAPVTGMVAVLTDGSDFDTLLWVFSGADRDALQFVGYNDNRTVENGSSLVVFAATAGTKYQFLVDGVRGVMGNIVLRLVTGQPPTAPTVAMNAVPVAAGSTLVLSADSGGGNGLSYQWLRNGVEIEGATGLTLAFPSAQMFHEGNYSLRVSNVFGTIVSGAVGVEVVEHAVPAAHLSNLSTRALALTGDDVLIPGFVVAGTGSKQLLIRAVGPTLATLGVPGVLPDPRLTLKRWNGTAYDDVAGNDNWSTNLNAADIVTKSAELFAFPLGAGSADAALLVDLAAGQYSVVADDTAGEAGIAIVELYDADAEGSAAQLINISNRGYVGTGDSIMIPGFVVSSEGPKTLLIRAVGPTLSSFGVSGVLADPTLSIFRHDFANNTDELILTNDDWSIGPGAQRTRDVAVQVQAFALPQGSLDAAFVVTLNPGVYTVHARGLGGSVGVALVEVYAVP